MMLRHTALGFAIAEADWEVREEGGNNEGPRIFQYLRNTVPPIHHAAPWCAAVVQYCADRAAQARGLTNPLDEVRLEALVQSYVTWARDGERIKEHPGHGDLVAFRFNGSRRWNHIGFVLRAPDRSGMFWTVEGNTGDPDADQRDGDGVYLKPRFIDRYPVTFIRWDAAADPTPNLRDIPPPQVYPTGRSAA